MNKIDKAQEDSINFINDDLIPEMIHNRCFCECGSREFVEFDSVVVEPIKKNELKDNREFYRAQLTIKFSGEPKIFPIIIKLLPHDALSNECTYGQFLNEEMFYNKMIAEYQLDIYPKCYVADMGRYGRPVIVMEDLEAIGYSRNCVLLDEDHMKLCLMAIAKFHARGIKLKKTKFEKFREFYAKIIEIKSHEDSSSSSLDETLELALGNIVENFDETTICHGKFNNDHLVFEYDNGKPMGIKVIGWNEIKHTLPIDDLKSIMNNNAIIKCTEFKNGVDYIKSIECIEKFINFYCAAYVEEINSSNEK